jgi:hypothetical protein
LAWTEVEEIYLTFVKSKTKQSKKEDEEDVRSESVMGGEDTSPK